MCPHSLRLLQEERVIASSVLSGPTDLPKVDRAQLVDDVRQALYAAKICSYAQVRESAPVIYYPEAHCCRGNMSIAHVLATYDSLARMPST